MSACAVCGVRTLKTREPLARTCSGCGKVLCNAHTHFYVDGQNAAITNAAPPKCATCSGMVTIHCFFGGCSHIVEHRDPEQGAAIMQGHYDRDHAADLTQLGYPTEPSEVGGPLNSSHPTVVYEDEWVTLYYGDYRMAGIEVLGGQRVDAIITDPPYGETSLEWDRWPTGWVHDAAQLTAAMWCWGSARMFHEHAAEFAADWKFSQDRVWEKHNGSGFHADRFKRVHESVYLWYRGEWADLRHETPTTPDATPRTVRRKTRPTHTGHIEASAYVSEDGGPRLMRSVQFARSEHGRAIHPTQKPIAVITPLIEYSVPPGGLVVDFFAGSASVAVAARQAGRRCIAFEAREEYAERAAQRLASELVFEEVSA